jgi:hypothetical protein
MNGRPVLELDDPLAPRPPAVAAPDVPDVDASETEDKPTPTLQRPERRRARRGLHEEPVEGAVGRDDEHVAPDLSVIEETSSSSRATGAWRHWAGGTRVASYRLPDELLEELDARARRLGVPIGMTVAAGLLQLFDQDDETIIGLVERAEDARVLGRRAARRRM